MVRVSFHLLIIVVLGSALFLCGSRVEVAALIWRFHGADLTTSVRLRSLGKPAQKEVEKYCHLLLTPALDEGTPGTLSKLYILGQTGNTTLNNYFANTLHETEVEIPVSTSHKLAQTLPQDVKLFLFLKRDGTLEVAGEAAQSGTQNIESAAIFADIETPFEHLLTVLEALARERAHTVYLAASCEGKFSFARARLITPGLTYTLFPNTLVALSDENSFFNHTKTSDPAAFERAIERAREESPVRNFSVRFVVAGSVRLEPLFKLMTFCLEKETSPLFKLLTDEDGFILDEEATLQGLKQ